MFVRLMYASFYVHETVTLFGVKGRVSVVNINHVIFLPVYHVRDYDFPKDT
jgi:hypothetical protein